MKVYVVRFAGDAAIYGIFESPEKGFEYYSDDKALKYIKDKKLVKVSDTEWKIKARYGNWEYESAFIVEWDIR